MKKGILILLIFLAAGCQHKVKKFTILGEGTPYVVYPEILNGRIQMIQEKSYWAYPHKGRYIRGRSLTREERMNLGGWSDDYKAVFDSNATLQICEALRESGIPEWKNEFVKEKNLIIRTNYFFHDTLVFYQLFKYGLSGNIISGKRYLAGLNALLGTARIRTNENGYPIEIKNYTAHGEPANTIQYTYDQKNRFIQFVLYNIKGEPINSHEAKYNRKNKIAEFVFRDENHQVLSTNNFIYQYDKKGNWIRAIVKISRGREKWFIIEERTYTYYPFN